MSASTGFSLSGFTAHELPPEKWMKLVSPKVRLRVGGTKKRNFVSSAVKVDNSRPDTKTDKTCTHWPWKDDERPSFANDEKIGIVIERRFWLRYKCIMRTKPVTIDHVRTDDHGLRTLPLYDGQHPAGELDDKVKIGEITFTLS